MTAAACIELPACTCRDSRACTFRASRGLVPFCQLPPEPPRPRIEPCAACVERSRGGLFGTKHGLVWCPHTKGGAK